MKVKYKCTYERVMDAITYAKEQDMEIDYIELCTTEWFHFHKGAGCRQAMMSCFEDEIVFQGVTIRRKK